ncbi:MAG: hypothetical protein M1308_22530, partial [Actinobacteria bacterium]|nr:hypothetical protein [Actinomycetota bacterium]
GNPNKYKSQVIRNTIDQWSFSQVIRFDKFEFGKVDKLSKGDLSNTIIFATPSDKLSAFEPVNSIRFLDGKIAFWVYQR